MKYPLEGEGLASAGPFSIRQHDGKKWEGQVYLPNGKKQRKGGFSTRKEALEWEIEQKKKPAKERTTTGTASLIDWANAYLDYALIKHVRKTFEEKRSALIRLLSYVKNDRMSVSEINPAIALKHLQIQMSLRSGNAANKDRKNLMAAWNWGMKFMTPVPPGPNPFLAVEKFSEKRKPRYVPPEKDFWEVVDSLPIDQDRVMLLTYIFTAARRDEISRLRREDVNLVSNELTLWYRKNRKGQWKARRLPWCRSWLRL